MCLKSEVTYAFIIQKSLVKNSMLGYVVYLGMIPTKTQNWKIVSKSANEFLFNAKKNKTWVVDAFGWKKYVMRPRKNTLKDYVRFQEFVDILLFYVGVLWIKDYLLRRSETKMRSSKVYN